MKDLSIKEIWEHVEKQISSVPYVDEDDEMEEIQVEDLLKLLDSSEEFM